MFEAKILEGAILKKIVEAIKDVVNDVNIDVSPSGKLKISETRETNGRKSIQDMPYFKIVNCGQSKLSLNLLNSIFLVFARYLTVSHGLITCGPRLSKPEHGGI